VASVKWERWARAAGIGFVVLTVAAFVAGGEPPTVADSTADVVSYYEDSRGEALVSSIVFGFALLFFMWFAAAIANLLRESGEGRLGATVTATTTAFVAVQLVLTGIGAALAYSIAGEGDAGVVRALFDLQWVLDLFAAVPSAGFFIAASIGLRRGRAVPAWLGWAGLVVAALFVLRTTNWAREGFWSPTGGYVVILIPVALLWILTTSVFLFRQAPTTTATVDATAAGRPSRRGEAADE
jgi:hypothetical protein